MPIRYVYDIAHIYGICDICIVYAIFVLYKKESYDVCGGGIIDRCRKLEFRRSA